MQGDGLITRALRKAKHTWLVRNVWVRNWGTAREREQGGLLKRPQYAYGLFRATDVARYFGRSSVTVCEFGVASGDGLLNLVQLADEVSRETGVTFRILGFDTGSGLPRTEGYKDHPEIWSAGDFPMVDQDELVSKTQGKAEIVFGDIADTVDAFVESLESSCPLGFVSIDVDVYSGAKSALRCLAGPPETVLPATSLYFDDVGSFFANDWCGELAAIREFNEEHEWRKIGPDRSLFRRTQLLAPWYACMYVCHALDHPARSSPRDRKALTMAAHHELMLRSHLF